MQGVAPTVMVARISLSANDRRAHEATSIKFQPLTKSNTVVNTVKGELPTQDVERGM